MLFMAPGPPWPICHDASGPSSRSERASALERSSRVAPSGRRTGRQHWNRCRLTHSSSGRSPEKRASSCWPKRAGICRAKRCRDDGDDDMHLLRRHDAHASSAFCLVRRAASRWRYVPRLSATATLFHGRPVLHDAWRSLLPRAIRRHGRIDAADLLLTRRIPEDERLCLL